jgi:hypothetical protein
LRGDRDVPILLREFDCDSYTLIRLYHLKPFEDGQILRKLDKIGDHSEIISILELADESWELGVLKAYIPKLEILLDEVFFDYSIDRDHRPFDPSIKAMKSFAMNYPQWSNAKDEKHVYLAAKTQMVDKFSRRANAMIQTGWPRAAIFYSHLLKQTGM